MTATNLLTFEDLKTLMPIMKKGLIVKGYNVKGMTDDKIVLTFYNEYAPFFETAYKPVDTDENVLSKSADGKFANILSGISNFFTRLNSGVATYNNTSVDAVNDQYQLYLQQLEREYQNQIAQRNTVLYVLIGAAVIMFIGAVIFKAMGKG